MSDNLRTGALQRWTFLLFVVCLNRNRRSANSFTRPHVQNQRFYHSHSFKFDTKTQYKKNFKNVLLRLSSPTLVWLKYNKTLNSTCSMWEYSDGYMLFSPTASLMFNLTLAPHIFSTWVNKEFISNPTRVGDCKNKRKTVLVSFFFLFFLPSLNRTCFTMIKLLFLQMESGGFDEQQKRGCFLVKQKRDLVFHKDVYRFRDPFHNVVRHWAKQSEGAKKKHL